CRDDRAAERSDDLDRCIIRWPYPLGILAQLLRIGLTDCKQISHDQIAVAPGLRESDAAPDRRIKFECVRRARVEHEEDDRFDWRGVDRASKASAQAVSVAAAFGK